MKYDNILRSKTLEKYLRKRVDKEQLNFLDDEFRKVSMALSGDDYVRIFEEYIVYIGNLLTSKMKNEEIIEGDKKHNFYYICSHFDKMCITNVLPKGFYEYTDKETILIHRMNAQLDIMLKNIIKFEQGEITDPNSYETVTFYMELFIRNKWMTIYDKYERKFYKRLFNDIKKELSPEEKFVAHAVLLDTFTVLGKTYVSFDDGNTFLPLDDFI